MSQAQDTRKRKRSISDQDAPPAASTKPFTRASRIVLAGKSGYFDLLIPKKDETVTQRASREAMHEHAEKLDAFKALVYFLHHKIDETKLCALLGKPEPSQGDAYMKWWDNNRKACKIRNGILNFVKRVVAYFVEENKKKEKGTGFSLGTMSAEDRMQQFWKPIFCNNRPLEFAQRMFAPVANIIDFVSIFYSLEHTNKDTKVLMKKWKTFVLQNWLAAADGEYRDRYLVRDNPDALDAPYNGGDSVWRLWDIATESLDAPGWEELPIRYHASCEIHKKFKTWYDKGQSHAKFGWSDDEEEDEEDEEDEEEGDEEGEEEGKEKEGEEGEEEVMVKKEQL